ncbi:MAG: tRNA uridine-5-carboxymethylaminomethyl(34) synthesis enzyme MnmG [Clostridia bacterium]
MNNLIYDAVVVGAGHAGCEAALALSRTNNKTLLITLNLDSIGFLACNPSIGGTAKGHLVCEIDALGGEMGLNADYASLQLRMLNLGKGPAVHSLRSQTDKVVYHSKMKLVLEQQENLTIKQAEAIKILVDENKKICGVETAQGQIFQCRSVVLACGVYLASKIIIGEYSKNCGPNGFESANRLTESIKNLGHEIFRFKTGTPARVNARTIDFSVLEKQVGDENIQTFSFMTKVFPANKKECYLTHTNLKTHELIKNNLHRAPLYNGSIKGVGPRYCPSIEDKVIRFADRDQHQLFLEPESENTNEYYVQGCSTSLPVEIQEELYHTIKGLEHVEIMRNAYAIEYDCINSLELKASLESKFVNGLFFAGQINGTSGYEEAAAQGIIAGINSNNYLNDKPMLILRRDQAYIGVLIDDLVTKGTNEPYRMMTSRAEYRLVLRQDNADERLTEIGRQTGLVTDERYAVFCEKQKAVNDCLNFVKTTKIKIENEIKDLFDKNNEPITKNSFLICDLLKRNSFDLNTLSSLIPMLQQYPKRVLDLVNIKIKFEGYIRQEEDIIAKMKEKESLLISEDFNYLELKGLRNEAKQKLNKIKPISLGQASRISGVSPADISVLSVYLHSSKK